MSTPTRKRGVVAGSKRGPYKQGRVKVAEARIVIPSPSALFERSKLVSKRQLREILDAALPPLPPAP